MESTGGDSWRARGDCKSTGGDSDAAERRGGGGVGRRGDPVLGKRGSGDIVSTSMMGELLLSQALQWLLVTDVF